MDAVWHHSTKSSETVGVCVRITNQLIVTFMISFTPVYDPLLILLSVGVAFIGSYITISLCEQLRLKKLPVPPSTVVLGEKGLVAAMALSLGGIAVWSMHLFGMSSMKLTAPDGSTVAIHYSEWRTVVSLVVVFVTSLIGVYAGSLDKMFGKTKQEILEVYVNHALKMSMTEVRKITPLRMIWIISTHSLGHLVGGGLIVGSGVSVMHYLGMWGLEFNDGEIVWDKGIVAASLLIAVFGSVGSFWILFRLLSLYCHWETLRLLSAGVMTIAICGSHYVCMAAAEFRFHPGEHLVDDHADNEATTLKDAESIALVLSFALLVLLLVEVRSQYHKLYVDWKKLVSTSSPSASASRVASRRASHNDSERKGSVTHSLSRSSSPRKPKTPSWRDRLNLSFKRGQVQPASVIEEGINSAVDGSSAIGRDSSVGNQVSPDLDDSLQNIGV